MAQRKPNTVESGERVLDAQTVRKVGARVLKALNFDEWLDSKDQGYLEQFIERWALYANTPVPNVSTLLATFGIDPNTVPSNNAFFSNGYITFSERDTSGNSGTGYRTTNPTLNEYPEGLTFDIVSLALQKDQWGLK